MPGRRPSPRNSLTSPDVRAVAVFVYALCEPDSGAVRYVGRSSNPQARLVSHMAQSSERVTAWIGGLRALGMAPQLRILREVPAGEDSAAIERLAIGEHIARGCDLLNVHGGNRRKGLKISFVPKNLGGAEMIKLGLSQVVIAEGLGCSQSQVHGWMRGRTVPTGIWRAAIEDSLGIYWRLWDQPLPGTKSEAA